jgi:hypothetical protein
MRRATALAGLLLLLASCVRPGARQSFVDPSIPATATDRLAAAIVSAISERLPAAASTVSLEPLAQGSTLQGSGVPAEVARGLRAAGYAVAEQGVKVTDAHDVRYLVSPDNGQILIRVTVDGVLIARVFSLTTDGLNPASAESVRESTR